MGVPFHDTVNMEQNPQDPIWVTAIFDSLYREVLTFCEDKVREEGDVVLVYSGRPGVGDTAMLAAIEADLPVLMAQRDPNKRLVILNRSAPEEYSGGSAQQDYQMAVYLDYEYLE